MTPQQFLQFANPLPEPTLLLLGNGTILAANRAVSERLSLSSQDVCERSLTSVVGEPAIEVEHYLRNCSRSRKMFLGALTVVDTNGRKLACRAEGAVVIPRDGDKEAVLLLRLTPKDSTVGQFLALNERIGKLGREILRRRETEDALRRQKEWLHVTLKSIGDAVIATDAGGNVVFMNPVAQSYLEYSEQEAVGRPLTDVFRILNEYSRMPADDPVSEVIQRGHTVGLANHTVLIDRHGGERPIEDSAAPIKDEEGKLLGVILVFHDVTQQRYAERELRNANQRKDEFLATLAHELRNPLAPIRNSLEILKQFDGSSEIVRGAHATMDRQLRQMVRLVDDLLDVSRISRGKLELRRQQVDLSSILSHSLETCRPLADCAGHRVTVTLPDNPAFVDADSVRLSQVFANLLNNACKFTEPGGHVELQARKVGNDVVVSVEDNGAGIPQENLESIFAMFSQVDSSLERSHGGLGIGLTLVKQVVELHGGSVEARSEGRGKGSKFIVRLPIISENTSVDAPAPDANKPTHVSYRILVVDDNRDAAMTLAMLLKMTGHETQMAFDGLEAFAAAQTFRPDLILLDIGLPQLNGYEVCRRIREQSWGRYIVVIALTGWGQEEDRRKSAEAGFNGHLVKPVDHAALRKLVSEMLPKSSFSA